MNVRRTARPSARWRGLAASTLLLATGTLVLLATGCAGFWSVAETDGTLEDAVMTYSKLVRWGELERASLFVDETLRPQFVALSPDMGRLRVTDFEVGPVDQSEEGVARVTVLYHAYDVETLVERRILEAQEWKAQSRSSWKVRPDLRAFQSALGVEPQG